MFSSISHYHFPSIRVFIRKEMAFFTSPTGKGILFFFSGIISGVGSPEGLLISIIGFFLFVTSWTAYSELGGNEDLTDEEISEKFEEVQRVIMCRYLALLCFTLLYSTLLYSTLLYSTLLYSFLLYSTLFYSPVSFFLPLSPSIFSTLIPS
jgi:hypothetical protein